MRRAGQLAVALVALVGADASAWHTGATFDKAPGAGGGGGLFYTASPRERGWDCTACHVEAPGELQLSMTVDPPELLAGTYTPGVEYTLVVSIVEERKGLRTGISNHNGMAVTVLDADGIPAGELDGAPDAYHFRGDNIIATLGTEAGLTEWTLTWEAPDPPQGEVGLYFGVVDGNGARTRPTVNLTDPLGDDVAMAALHVVPR